jgi:small subunit ribosomal protein S20
LANIKSAEKNHRQSVKRRARNVHVRAVLRTAIRKVREAVTAKDGAKAKEALRAAEITIRKAASKGVMHRRNADRHVARLAHSVSQLAGK